MPSMASSYHAYRTYTLLQSGITTQSAASLRYKAHRAVHCVDGDTRAGNIPLGISRMMVLDSVVPKPTGWLCLPPTHNSARIRRFKTGAHDPFGGGSYIRGRWFLEALVVTWLGFVHCESTPAARDSATLTLAQYGGSGH